MRVLLTIAIALALALPTAVFAAPTAGEDYRVLSQPQPTDDEQPGVLVTEFFSYACPHCFDFHPKLEAWQESRDASSYHLQRVPVSFGRDSWALLARAYYVAEALDVLDKTHAALFDAIHVDGRRFDTPESIADFYSTQGVDRDAALQAFDSFAVNMKMKRAERLVRDYGIRSTPSLAIDGRFVVDPRSAGGQDEMLDVTDALIEQPAGD